MTERVEKQIIPAGLTDNSVEFYTDYEDLKCIYNSQVHSFPDFPEYVIGKIQQGMIEDGLEDLELMKEWASRKYGHFDMEPDIDSQGNFMPSEYTLGRKLEVSNGFLTKQELEILRRVELPDKIIADELGISIETVSRHWQNIRVKTGKRNKIELAVFAVLKGLIKPTIS